MKIVFHALDLDTKADYEIPDNWTIVDIALLVNSFKITPYFFVEVGASWKRYYINGEINRKPSKDFQQCGIPCIISFDQGRTVFAFNDEDEQLMIHQLVF